MRFTQIFVAVALLMTGSLAMAETTIGVLNVQGVVLGSNMANDFRAQLERDMKPKQESLKAKAQELQKMQEDSQRDAAILSEEQKRELTVTYGQKVREFQRLQEEIGREQSEKEKAFIDSVRPKLDEVVNRIVQDRKIDLLIDRQAVLFASAGSNLDISQEVLTALNAAK